MATTIHSLAVKVTSDTAGFTKGMTATRKELTQAKRILRETETPLDRYQRSVKEADVLLKKGAITQAAYNAHVKKLGRALDGNATPALNRYRSGMMSLAGPMKIAMVAAGAGIALLGKRAVKLAADFETSRTGFATMLGSTEKAVTLLNQLDKFSATTPFEPTEIRAAAMKLLSFGVAQEDVITRFKVLGDVAAGSNSRVGELASIFGKMRSSGIVALGDLNQLGDRGIPIFKQRRTPAVDFVLRLPLVHFRHAGQVRSCFGVEGNGSHQKFSALKFAVSYGLNVNSYGVPVSETPPPPSRATSPVLPRAAASRGYTLASIEPLHVPRSSFLICQLLGRYFMTYVTHHSRVPMIGRSRARIPAIRTSKLFAPLNGSLFTLLRYDCCTAAGDDASQRLYVSTVIASSSTIFPSGNGSPADVVNGLLNASFSASCSIVS